MPWDYQAVPGASTSPFYSYVGTNFLVNESSSSVFVYSGTPLEGYSSLDSFKVYLYGSFSEFDRFGNAELVSVTRIARYTNDQLIDELTGLTYSGHSFAGYGNDTQFLTGNDTFHGFAGSDIMFSSDGDDAVYGYGGNDFVNAGIGFDTIYGGAGNDNLDGGNGGGNEEPDASIIYGGNGNDTIASGAANDSQYGGNGSDTLYSWSGDDVLSGGSGADWMEGGRGNDTYYVDSIGDLVFEYSQGEGLGGPSSGYDTVFTAVSFDATGNLAIEVLDARQALQGVSLVGNDLTEKLLGSAYDDVLTGWRPNYGNTTTFDGRGGDDTMIGGLGLDNYYVDSAGDVILDPGDPNTSPDGGLDVVFASTSYTLGLGQRLEKLIGNAGSTGLALTGNEFANLVRGKGGADTLAGGLGVDTLTGGGGPDTFVLQPFRADRDRITDFEHGVDDLLVSESVFGELDGPGLAFADRFLSNGTGRAVDGGTADTRFIFNTTDGNLYFDANGAANGQTRQIASLTGVHELDALDFMIL